MDFVDRKNKLDRLQKSLKREKPQFIVIYGRRRIGKVIYFIQNESFISLNESLH